MMTMETFQLLEDFVKRFPLGIVTASEMCIMARSETTGEWTRHNQSKGTWLETETRFTLYALKGVHMSGRIMGVDTSMPIDGDLLLCQEIGGELVLYQRLVPKPKDYYGPVGRVAHLMVEPNSCGLWHLVRDQFPTVDTVETPEEGVNPKGLDFPPKPFRLFVGEPSDFREAVYRNYTGREGLLYGI